MSFTQQIHDRLGSWLCGSNQKTSGIDVCISYITREDAEVKGFPIPAPACVPQAGYLYRDVIVMNTGKYIGTLRIINYDLYLFDVSFQITGEQLEHILKSFVAKQNEIRVFQIEYPEQNHDDLQRITKSNKRLGHLIRSYCIRPEAKNEDGQGHTESSSSHTTQREKGEEVSHALYHDTRFRLYSARKLQRLYERGKLEQFISDTVSNSDGITLARIENTINLTEPTAATEAAKTQLFVLGLKLVRKKRITLDEIYEGKLLAEIDRYNNGSRDREQTIGELYASNDKQNLLTLEKLHKVVVEENRFLQQKKSQRTRSIVDIILHFVAPVVVALVTTLIMNLLLSESGAQTP